MKAIVPLLILALLLSGCTTPQPSPPLFTPYQLTQLQTVCPQADFNKIQCPSVTCPAFPLCPACNASATCEPEVKTFTLNHTEQADCYNLDSSWLGFTGNSMNPFMSEGNRIKVKPYFSGMALHQGNIIAFDLNGSLTVHAIQAIYPDYLLTQGYNRDSQERISYPQIRYLVTDVRFC